MKAPGFAPFHLDRRAKAGSWSTRVLEGGGGGGGGRGLKTFWLPSGLRAAAHANSFVLYLEQAQEMSSLGLDQPISDARVMRWARVNLVNWCCLRGYII